MNKRVLTGVLALLLFIAGFIKAEALSYHEGDVEEYVMQQLAAANVPGVSLSIVTSQKEIYSVAFGDVKETSSALQIGALTSTFTTLAIMQLVEKGDISLGDRVQQYIKKPSQDIRYNTTIQELLSYTKPEEHGFALADAMEAYNMDAEVDRLPVNVKFNLLGQVIEAVSGMDYAAYIREKITTPLDMQSTYTIEEAGSVQNITLGCKNYFGLPLKDREEYTNEDYWLGVPSNGLVSNVKDIGKYMQMYLAAGGKVISYNTMESIMGEGEYAGKSIFGTDAYYTMGWISTETDGKQIYYCNGSVENYTSAMFIIPSMDIGVVILFNSADALTGQKYTDKIEAGAVSLIMGGTARAVSSNSYLMEHGAADVIYFLAFVCSIFPLLMMEAWVRWTKEKFSIIRTFADILLHIALPTLLIFAVNHYIAPWLVIKKVMPDLFFVLIVVTGLLYLGLIVKIFAYLLIYIKGDREEGAEEDTEEDREAKEKKDKLVKRMKSIKEASIDESGNINAETEESLTGENRISGEEVVTGAEEDISEEEAVAETVNPATAEMPYGTTAIPVENTINVTSSDETEDNVESGALPKEDIRKRKLPGTETRAEIKTKVRTEKARPGSNPNSRPKKYIVTSPSAAPKRDRGSSLPENKRDKNINRVMSKAGSDNRRRVNRNNNSAVASKTTREGSSLNRKGESPNNRKVNNSSINIRNSDAKDRTEIAKNKHKI